MSYVRQQEPAGLGHAVWCARHQIGNEPVAVLLADDLILGEPALAEMVAAYQGGNMVAVMPVAREDTGSYGIITPGEESGNQIEVKGLVEKPSPEAAPSTLAVVGRYIIEPEVFSTLSEGKKGAGGEIQLTDALASRIGHAPFAGVKFSGQRFDCGSKLGFIKANMAFALQRDELCRVEEMVGRTAGLMKHHFHPTILRSYDIRGQVGTTSAPMMPLPLVLVLPAIKSTSKGRVAVGRDGRLSSPDCLLR